MLLQVAESEDVCASLCALVLESKRGMGVVSALSVLAVFNHGCHAWHCRWRSLRMRAQI